MRKSGFDARKVLEDEGCRLKRMLTVMMLGTAKLKWLSVVGTAAASGLSDFTRPQNDSGGGLGHPA
jgi:hypothetical protein